MSQNRDALAHIKLEPKQDGSNDKYILMALVTDASNDKPLNDVEVYVENWENDAQTVDLTGVTGSGDNELGRVTFEVPPISLQVAANPDGYKSGSVVVDASEFN